MTLVKINPKEYGVTSEKASYVSGMFKPMLEKMVELEKEYNEIKSLDINPDTCSKAKKLRLEYVKVRTGTAKIHKELKYEFLQAGRFIDGWKNAQLMSSQGIEEDLKAIEEHYQRLEEERINNLQVERAGLLERFEIFPIPGNLGKMDDKVWENFHAGVKVNFERMKAAAEAEERERKERERLEAEERERVRIENERLKAELEEKERIRQIEAKKKEEERKAQEEQARKEREAYEAKIKEEQEKAERMRLEIERKKEEERKAQEEQARKERERIEAELAKGDKDKVSDLILDLKNICEKYKFESSSNKKMFSDVKSSLKEIMMMIAKSQ